MAASAEEGMEAGAEEADDAGLLWFLVREEYVGRFAQGRDSEGLVTADDSDHDLRTFAAAGASDRTGAYSADFSAGLWWDLDGVAPSPRPLILGSARDDTDPQLEVYSLWGQYESVSGETGPGVRTLRAGRQITELGIPTTFDGMFSEVGLGAGFSAFLVGGRSVHFFESDDELFEDWIASTGVAARLVRGLKVTADYRLDTEDNPAVSSSRLYDNSYGMEVKYRPVPAISLSGYMRGLDGSLSHLGLGTRIATADADAGLDLKADAQTVQLDEVTEGLDPYFAILGPSLPNLRWLVHAWKDVPAAWGDLTFQAGWQGRVLLEGEAREFNRSFAKAYVLLGAEDVGRIGLFANGVAELHTTGLSPGNVEDEGSVTVGGETGWNADAARVAAGTFYARYKYRYFADVEELADVRTYYAEASGQILDWLSAKLRYELERFDWDVHYVSFSLEGTY